MRLLSLILAALSLSACNYLRAPRPVDPPPVVAPEAEPLKISQPMQAPASLPSYRGGEGARSAENSSGPAVLSLLKQADTARKNGRSDQASAALERALRIEPRNPFVWHSLAQLHLDAGRAEQAESTAQKSNSLGKGNPQVQGVNWRLIAQARELLSDSAGAALANEKADAYLGQRTN